MPAYRLSLHCGDVRVRRCAGLLRSSKQFARGTCKNGSPPWNPPIPPPKPPIPPPAPPPIPPRAPPQLGPQCVPPPPPPIPPLASTTTPSRLTVMAAEGPQGKQTGRAAATGAAPTQSKIKINAAIVGSRRMDSPSTRSALATIEAWSRSKVRFETGPRQYRRDGGRCASNTKGAPSERLRRHDGGLGPDDKWFSSKEA
jgi:hypothetical protein